MTGKKKPQGTLHPAPTMKVRFADGKIVEMNRQQRRQMKLYNHNLKREG